MNGINRILWYQSMAASDLSALLSPEEMREYLEMRHRTKRTAVEPPARRLDEDIR